MATKLNGCPTSLDGIGGGTCITSPILGMIQGIIPESESHSYDSLEDFKDEDKVKESIASKDILPLRIFSETEAANFDEVTSETSAGVKIFHSDMKYGLIGYMRLSPDENRIVQTYTDKIKKCYIYDGQGNRQGTYGSDGVSIEGMSIEYFRVSPVELNVAIDGKSFTKVEIRFSYLSEFNETPVVSIASELDPYWDPIKVIKPLTKLTITPSTVAANAFTFSVAYVNDITGQSETFSGADEDNFEVLDEDGAVVSATITESTTVDGDYAATGTLASGSIRLKASADSLKYSDVTTLTAAG